MQKRGVAQKSERAHLFRRLHELYAQQRLPVVDCVLPFPLLQIAEARVWRDLPPPDADDLHGALAAVGQQGMPVPEVNVLVALTEALFRPLRVVGAGG